MREKWRGELKEMEKEQARELKEITDSLKKADVTEVEKAKLTV